MWGHENKRRSLELSDWEQIANADAKLGGIGPDTPEYANMRNLFTGIWSVLQSFADTNRDQRVSLEEFLVYGEAAYRDVKGVSWEQLPARERAMFEAMLAWVDRDGDGKISYDDYSTWLSAWLGPDASPKAAFERLDPDGDGYVSMDEARQYVAEFVMSDDPNALGNWIFG